MSASLSPSDVVRLSKQLLVRGESGEKQRAHDEQKANPSKIWEKIGNAEILLKPLGNHVFLDPRNDSDFCDQKPFKNHWENKHLLIPETKPFLGPARTPKTL